MMFIQGEKRTADLQTALQATKVQVRKFAEQTMTLMDDLKKLEEGFGVASTSAKQSSSEIHKRCVEIEIYRAKILASLTRRDVGCAMQASGADRNPKKAEGAAGAHA
eukprot:SAG11_NODE_6698_length_1264_cov_1.854077_2_plen_107_part_00